MWQYTDSTDSVVSIDQPGGPLLRVGARRRDRVQDEPVQHRRRRPVPHGGSARRRCRCGRELHAGHPGVLHHPRGGGGRSRVGGDRRDLEGVAGRQRGALDDHAQLRSPPASLAYLLTNYLRAKNETGDLVTKTKPLPPSSFIPPLNRFFELFGFHLPPGTAAQRLPRRRRPPRRRLLRARVAHPLRLRSASDRCEPGGGSGRRASTPRR